MIRMCTYSSILGAKVSLMHNEDNTKQAKTLSSIKYRLQILLLIQRKLKRIIQLLFLLKSENLWFCDSIRENRCELIHLKFAQKQKRELTAICKILALHCVKIVRIRSFPGPCFPAFRLNTESTEHLFVFSPNAGRHGPEKLRIRTLFIQCHLLRAASFTHSQVKILEICVVAQCFFLRPCFRHFFIKFAIKHRKLFLRSLAISSIVKLLYLLSTIEIEFHLF